MSTVGHLFSVISRVEIYVDTQSWAHTNTVEGTVAVAALMNSTIAAKRESAECGIRLYFSSAQDLYGLGDYPGFKATSAPRFATVVRQLNIGDRLRSGMCISGDELSIAYPGICLHWADGTRRWLDEPLITSISIMRDDPRGSFIKWR